MGRKSIDRYMGDYLIPKMLCCSKCKREVTNPYLQFIARIERLGVEPQEFVDSYVCRDCKREEREATTEVKPKKTPEEIIHENVTRNLGGAIPYEKVAFDGKPDRIGFLIAGEPISLATNVETHGISMDMCRHATDVIHYNKPSPLVIKHVGEDPVNISDLLMKFKDATIYDSENLVKAIKQLLKEDNGQESY